MGQESPEGSNRLYNSISTLFLILTALTVCGVVAGVAFFAKPGGVAQAQPTLMVGFPTNTATLSGPTAPATYTASPSPTITDTPTVTTTPVPSRTATPTDTPTATNTLTPTVTSTATNTPLPTNTATRSPFDFVLKDNAITYIKYTKVPNDCGARIAGAVFNTTNAYITGFNIHVTGPSADFRFSAGSKPEYGTSGWEFYIFNTPVARTYNVQLEYPDGPIASDVISVTTKNDCNQGVAIVNFKQVQQRSQ
jgi:hypothetical protein